MALRPHPADAVAQPLPVVASPGLDLPQTPVFGSKKSVWA